MKTFVDNSGKTWTVSITVGTIKRVKDLLGINLIQAITGDLIEKLETDICLFVDILYVVCKDQAQANSISDEKFGTLLGGDSLEQATDCFLDELISFFPEAKRRLYQKAWSRSKEAQLIAVQKLQKKIQGMNFQQILENKLNSI